MKDAFKFTKINFSKGFVIKIKKPIFICDKEKIILDTEFVGITYQYFNALHGLLER
jgi:hypothetical protein